ncbi:hypothetical protein [Haloferula sargassicola]|uniref:Peptidase C-terminal archaeal/bacterial domain-containing protein n=1 Tax=Haloferula sargassicola TaxID=490096 RepID=A0ABP9UU24_9BACT
MRCHHLSAVPFLFVVAVGLVVLREMPTPPHASDAPAAVPFRSLKKIAPWNPAGGITGGRGSRVELPFDLDGVHAGRITQEHQFPDGRRAISLRLADGGDFHLVSLGDRWEARVVPHAEGGGWRLEGDSSGTTVTPLEKSALLCHGEARSPESAGLPPMLGFEKKRGLQSKDELSIPLLHSIDGATAVIYLDFDGETVSGTHWNSSYNGGAPLVAGAAPFSAREIEDIWLGVSEDYSPFEVNVTTDRAAYEAAPVNRRVMVVFTPDNEWYGSSGGVAYIDTFGSPLMDPPAWVFTDQLSDRADFAAEAAAHEAGHTLGLRHDGGAEGEYHRGNEHWAPIMGAAYNAAVSQWSRGEYAGATNTEDDLEIISSPRNGFGYYPDDHAGTPAAATAMEIIEVDTLEGWGYIERDSDRDVFRFQTTGGVVTAAADPIKVHPDLDLRLELWDAAGNEVAVSDPADALDAAIATSLPGGTYFLAVSGVGNEPAGYTGYGSLGEYDLRVTAPQDPSFAAEIVSPAAEQVSLPFGTGLRLEGIARGGIVSWQAIQVPAGGSVNFSDPSASSTDAVFSVPGIYQVRFASSLGDFSVNDIVTVAVDDAAPTFGFRVPAVDLGLDRDVYGNQATLSPLVPDDPAAGGFTYTWRVLSGPGQLSSPDVARPALRFTAAYSPVRMRLEVSDGASVGFAEVSLTAHFKSATFAAPAAYARVLVPSAEPPAGWSDPLFNDFAWTSGNLGAGYDLSGNSFFQPELHLDLSDTMSAGGSTCYVRIPFYLMVAPENVLSLQLRMKYDDGFVAYINGTEVARDNAGDGTPAWNGTASEDRPDEAALSSKLFTLDLPPGTLSNGSNVLAIHALNAATTGGDDRFLIAAEMTGVIADPDPNPPTLTPFEICVSGIADPTRRGAEDDPDGDGLSNLFEHAMGTAPDIPDSVGEVVRLPDVRHVHVRLPATPPDDVRYLLEHTSALAGDWQVIAEKIGAGEWSGLTPAVAPEDVEGGQGYDFPLTGEAAGFYRLRMELVP